MIKQMFIGVGNAILESNGDTTRADRWYKRYHSKEVIRFIGPWLRRYETYQSFAPSEEAMALGLKGGLGTEIWYTSLEEYLEAKPNDRPYTPQKLVGKYSAADRLAGSIVIPAMPTEDFLGKEPTPEETSIVRWCSLIKYPENLSAEECDEWYLNVHAEEAKTQDGLLRYISYRRIDNSPIKSSWYRYVEMWYESLDHWHKAVIESPPRYTPAPWSDKYPFIDSVSTFLPYKPVINFLKDDYLIP